MPDRDIELGLVVVLAVVIACTVGIVMARRMFPPMRVRADRVFIAVFLIPVFVFAVIGLLAVLGNLLREKS